MRKNDRYHIITLNNKSYLVTEINGMKWLGYVECLRTEMSKYLRREGKKKNIERKTKRKQQDYIQEDLWKKELESGDAEKETENTGLRVCTSHNMRCHAQR